MPLNIPVNSDYKITSDAMNVIVCRRHIIDPTKSPNWKRLEAQGASPEPREEWKEVAYLPTIDKAIEWIFDQQIRDSNAQTLTELLEEIKRFRREIKAIQVS